MKWNERKLAQKSTSNSPLEESRTIASDAYIYIADASEQSSPQSLSPEATRLLLARRLGLSRYHSLEGADESTLRILNEFGGKQQALLSIDEQWLDPRRNLIVVEDVENLEELLHSNLKPTFTMTNIPDSSQTVQLVKDLFQQALSQSGDEKMTCSYNFPDKALMNGGVLGRQDKSGESTIILLPPSNPKAKRTSTSSYGNYAMPNRLQARKAQIEAPLTGPPAPETSLPSHRVSAPQVLKASSAANPGILPVCHPNLDKLIDATNNCSGHGTPYLKRPKSSDPKAFGDCYACRCGKTVLSRGEGKGVKTVDWAGPACSKKDVSMPFWLLAGISIAMVATVSWGVGLLFSIGQEDLPSVIGAGVAGPRAQK
ncbi:MAG: hypothetical protein Q9186_004545 [Xanthomendoza sp. 1 TL-2023]